tara:strand:+ start:371 stop:685 length:315 start_codon:yes stop_codon:yes gene_type:complete
MNCSIHGEVGIHPYISKALGHELDIKSSLALTDIQRVKVNIYEDNQLLSNDFYLLANEVLSDIKHLVIRNEQDEEKFLKPLMPKFKGGGYCVKCFSMFLSKISA